MYVREDFEKVDNNDVRVFDPNANSHINTNLQQCHIRCCNQRILQIEHGTFTPLVFSIYGSVGRECSKFYSRLADLISVKKNSLKSSNGELDQNENRFRAVEIVSDVFTWQQSHKQKQWTSRRRHDCMTSIRYILELIIVIGKKKFVFIRLLRREGGILRD